MNGPNIIFEAPYRPNRVVKNINNEFNQINENISDLYDDIKGLPNPVARLKATPKPKNPLYSPNPEFLGPQTTVQSTISFFFNQFNFILIVWLLAVYFFAFVVLDMFIKTELVSQNMMISKTIDFVTFSMMFILFFYYYYSLSEENQTHIVYYLAELLRAEMKNPNTIVYVVFFIIILYLFIFLFRVPRNSIERPYSIHLLESTSLIYLVMLLIIQFFNYVLGIPIVDLVYDYIYDFWKCQAPTTSPPTTTPPVCYPKPTDPKTSPPKTSPPATTPPKNAEVFNISNNLYTYSDAPAVCKAMGAELATLDQIEDAHKHGAEWCNYGWSTDQMAFFPTQKDTWKRLQENNGGVINDKCGRPGINGGVMDPKLKFGVNCFGVKPNPTDKDSIIMEAYPDKDQPLTAAQLELQKKTEEYKQLLKNMTISAFKNNQWSKWNEQT